MQDSERQKSLWHRRNSAGLSEVLTLAGRCSDHKKGISPFVRRCGAVSDPRAPAAFPSKEEGRSSAEDGGDMAQETFVAILSTTPPRASRFRKHWWSTSAERLPNSFRLSSEQSKVFGPMADRWGTTTDSYSFRFFSAGQVDQILRDGAKPGPAGSHATIERILKLEPEAKRAELWRRIRHHKYPTRATRCRRNVRSAEDDQILSTGYEKGW